MSASDERLWTALRLADFKTLDRQFTGYARAHSDQDSRRKAARLARIRKLERSRRDIFWTAVEAARRVLRDAPISPTHRRSLRQFLSALTSKVEFHAASSAALTDEYYRESRILRENIAPFLLEQMYGVIERVHCSGSLKNSAGVVLGLFLLSAVDTDLGLRPSAFSLSRALALAESPSLGGGVQAFLREAISSASTFGDRDGEKDLVREARRLLRRNQQASRHRTRPTSGNLAVQLPNEATRPPGVVRNPRARAFTLVESTHGVLSVVLPNTKEPKPLLYQNGPKRTDKVTAKNKVGRTLISIALGRHDEPIDKSTWMRARRALRKTCGPDLQILGDRRAPRFSRRVSVLQRIYDLYLS